MNHRLFNELLDLRDCRIRLGYKVIALEDKSLWEPNAFTEEDAFWLRYYRAEIAQIKAKEEELRIRMYKGE